MTVVTSNVALRWASTAKGLACKMRHWKFTNLQVLLVLPNA